MSNTILVSNISPSTSEKEIKDFLSFCGKISSLELKEANGTKTAEVAFEKESAAKTALLLDHTSLGSNEIHVSAGTASGSAATTSSTTATHHDDEHGENLDQEDKPRTRIFAEYLAHGYKIGDQVLQKGIEIDKQHGISSRFTKALQDFDKKTGATDKAVAVDNKYSISNTATKSAQNAWLGLSSYYEKFAGTPTGSKLHAFYSNGNKQVQDIHQEALRLAGLKTTSGTYTAEKVGVDEHGVTKTHCQCGGADGVCGCKAGECTCKGCSKSEKGTEAAELSGTTQQTATGAADKIAEKTGIDPLAGQK